MNEYQRESHYINASLKPAERVDEYDTITASNNIYKNASVVDQNV